uniref:Uncharacterized protein n=1 Tax=Romanomermis culicivorax TaxID=13658 RepID=A0A915IZ44_ROMCU
MVYPEALDNGEAFVLCCTVTGFRIGQYRALGTGVDERVCFDGSELDGNLKGSCRGVFANESLCGWGEIIDLADGQADVAGILKSAPCCVPTDYSGADNRCGGCYFFRRDDHICGGSRLIDSTRFEGGRGYGHGRSVRGGGCGGCSSGCGWKEMNLASGGTEFWGRQSVEREWSW